MREGGDPWTAIAIAPSEAIARHRSDHDVMIDLHGIDDHASLLPENDVVEVRSAGIRAGVLIALDVDAVEIDGIEWSRAEVDRRLTPHALTDSNRADVVVEQCSAAHECAVVLQTDVKLLTGCSSAVDPEAQDRSVRRVQ